MVIVFLSLDEKEKSQNSTFKKSPTITGEMLDFSERFGLKIDLEG